MKFRPKKCKFCNKKFIPTRTFQPCCSKPDCAMAFWRDKESKRIKKSLAKRKKNDIETRRKNKARKKEIMTRAEWYNKLQDLVNQWVLHVRDKNEPCITCGTTNPNIKYDAGHCFTRAARPDIRFELTNIHKQCSVKCNQHGSGMRAEYYQAIIDKYGADHLELLKKDRGLLKDVFPHWSDIEQEIIRYRKLIRKAGLIPRR